MNIEKALGKRLKKNEPLSRHTTFQIGGPASFFYEARNTKEIEKAVKIAHDLDLKLLVLGGGSNLLVGDKGFDGLVIKITSNKYSISSDVLEVDAGVNLSMLSSMIIRNGYEGLEFSAGIPGSVGGAIRGNAGAYGKSIGEMTESVEVIDLDSKKIKKLSNKQLKFKYRSSVIKEKNYLILKAFIKLEKLRDKKIVRLLIVNNLKHRNANQPLACPSAGCVFKNIKYSDKYQNLKDYAVYNKIPTARLIDELGLKNKKVGGAKVSAKHANFIINEGGAKASDVIKLIGIIKDKVKERFGVELEEEIKII